MGFLRYTILTLIVIIFLAAEGFAQDYVNADGFIHSFNNNVTVYTAVFALNKDISLETSTYFKYTVDLINPDIGDLGEGGGEREGERERDNIGQRYRGIAAVSGASTSVASGDTKDTRNEFTFGLTHNFRNVIGVEAYYDYSKEKDYTSNTPTITLKKDLFDKNTTLTLAYSRSMDEIYGKFMDDIESKNTDNYFFGITQILSPVTISQIGYSRSNVSGFTSEGIRLVPLNGADQGQCTAKSAICVDESFPDSRFRDGYIFGISHYISSETMSFFDRSSVKFTFRYYSDDWDIKSYTEEVEYNKYITEHTMLRLNLRYYDQTKAYFVKDIYTGAEEFKSSSPQLLGFNSWLGGVKLAYYIYQNSFIEGKYEYYNESIDVNANVFMLGLRLIF